MSHEPIVHIVDDDKAMLRSLRLVVESADLTARLFESAEQFLESYNPKATGCIVLDLKMAGMSGFDLYEQLRDGASHLPIIFLTGHGDVVAAVHAMKMGAVDFLEKPVDHHLLVDRIRVAIEIDVEQRRDQEEKEPVLQALRSLTPREQEVLDLVVDGQGNKEIAARLHRSIRTVENHRARILRKFDVRSSTQLISRVIQAKESLMSAE